jgi:glycosyltransferase involved in cell wall biosynthesis
VVECRVSPKLNTRQRASQLAAQFRDLAPQCDVILLAEFNQSLALPAWQLARRFGKRLVIDAFTSVYDSAVYDREVARPNSLTASRYWLIDWLACRLADRLLVDTAQHADYFASTFGASRSKLTVIPVGASHEWFETPSAPHHGDHLLVSFFGTYIPLHGIDIILRAAYLLSNRPDIRFEVIGRGQTYQPMQSLVADLALTNVTFLDAIPPADLPTHVAQADICLGIFGTTQKAARVVPNKVYQTLALGKPVLTADTPALRDLFIPGTDLLAVLSGDPHELADAIATLADDPGLRASLAAAGRAHMESTFTESALGSLLLNLLS